MFFKSSQLIEILKYIYMKQVLRITVNTVQVTDFRSLRMAGNNDWRILSCPSETNWIFPVRIAENQLSCA